MPHPCTICQTEDASPEFRVGAKCAERLGLRPLIASRRPPVPCTRCSGTQFIRVLPRVYETYSSHDLVGGRVINTHSIGLPMTVTSQPPPVEKHLFAEAAVAEPETPEGLGALETFICRGCGFVEWYCVNPQDIPIGHEYNSELIDYGSSR